MIQRSGGRRGVWDLFCPFPDPAAPLTGPTCPGLWIEMKDPLADPDKLYPLLTPEQRSFLYEVIHPGGYACGVYNDWVRAAARICSHLSVTDERILGNLTLNMRTKEGASP